MKMWFGQWTVAAAIVGLAMAATACGADDDAAASADTTAASETTTSGAGPGGTATTDDVATYCDSFFAVEGEFASEEPDPAEVGTLLDNLESVHPDEIDEQIDVMIAGARD